MSSMIRTLCTGLLLLFSTLGLASSAAAQGRISGTVKDAGTGETLVGANVIIQGTSIGAATDADGRYTITSAPVGTRTLVVSYLGYDNEERTVTIPSGGRLTENFELTFGGVEGEEVIVTAQASGQLSAINQQLQSNTISNIVSADRIQELPDVNAAESIGRLPGVSIQRSGGEATKIAIRGLSPKYSTVTVNGVRVPSTGGDDRDVDLSLISSNMLGGIEVKKAITPDMDADAVAGSVDLKLRNAPAGFLVDVLAQGGYNQLQDYYGNYKVAGTLSNRFVGNRLGVIATANIDRYDRSADKFNAGYRRVTNLEGDAQMVINSLNLREEVVERGRTGASFLFDYKIPLGTITGNTFYNQLSSNGTYRVNRLSVENNRHFYDLNATEGKTSILTGALSASQDFGWVQYDATVSRSASRNKNPRDYTWNFVQETSAFNFGSYLVSDSTRPTELLNYATLDSASTGLADVYYDRVRLEENQTGLQMNLTFPFRLGNHFDGYLKTGGKLRWLDRANNRERTGRNGLQYGTTGGRINQYLLCANSMITNGFNGYDIQQTTAADNVLPIYVFNDGYTRDNFLDGDYELGYTVNPEYAKQFSQALDQCGYFKEYPNESRGSDYSGDERYHAGYVMAEINLGRYVTLIPGVRYEADWSKYQGQRFREVVLNNEQREPTDLDTLTVERDFSFWLPMLHLQIDPAPWLKIRLARTKTLQRPGYQQYAPISRIDAQQQYAYAGNSLLKPAQSTNYDAAVSIYQNYVGLFTAAAFHKSVQDHIIWVRYFSSPARPLLPGLNVPDEWIVDPKTGKPNNPKVDTYINNRNDAVYYGAEFDWQTNFWYLPSFLKGLVLNVNYTRIFSDTKYDAFTTESVCVANCGTRREVTQTVTIDTSRVGRMVDQPANVANVTLGYDIKGFSARLSYLYQDDRAASIAAQVPAEDTFSGAYSRVDLTLRQKLSGRFNGLEFFANFNNLNNREDRNFITSPTSGDPTYVEYYGFTMDLGARYRF